MLSVSKYAYISYCKIMLSQERTFIIYVYAYKNQKKSVGSDGEGEEGGGGKSLADLSEKICLFFDA